MRIFKKNLLSNLRDENYFSKSQFDFKKGPEHPEPQHEKSASTGFVGGSGPKLVKL